MNLCHQSQNFLKKDVPRSALTDKKEPFFLNMAINISIAILKGHSLPTSSTCIIDELDDSAFQYVFQSDIVPFSFLFSLHPCVVLHF